MVKKHSNVRNRSSVNDSKRKAISFFKFISLILPLIAYVIITVFVFPSPNSGFVFLGIIGSIIFGLGLVNITGHLDKTNLGIEVSGFTLGLGGIMIAISSAIMYIPSIYAHINEQQVTFYFLIWTFILVSVLYYAFFRGAMKRYMCSQGVSKSHISKLLKGSLNFWLYKAANNSLDLKWMYRINKLYVFCLLASSTLHLLLGWCAFLAPLVATITAITLSFNLPMWSLVISTWEQGTSKKNNEYGIRLYAGYLLPAGAVAATIMYTLKVFFA